MTMSEVHSAFEAAGVLLDEPVPLHSDNISKSPNGGDGGQAVLDGACRI